MLWQLLFHRRGRMPPMRLVRYGPEGREMPGLLDDAGGLRDLSYVVTDLGPDEVDPDWMEILRAIEPETLPRVPGNPRLGVPLTGIGRVLDETGREVSSRSNSLAAGTGLAAVINLAGQDIPVAAALGHVAGYTALRADAAGGGLRLGPWLVGADAVRAPPAVAAAIAGASRATPLEPGDVVTVATLNISDLALGEPGA